MNKVLRMSVIRGSRKNSSLVLPYEECVIRGNKEELFPGVTVTV